MPAKSANPFPNPPKRFYYGVDIPMRVIRRYARASADTFHPDKIDLFGSRAFRGKAARPKQGAAK